MIPKIICKQVRPQCVRTDKMLDLRVFYQSFITLELL